MQMKGQAIHKLQPPLTGQSYHKEGNKMLLDRGTDIQMVLSTGANGANGTYGMTVIFAAIGIAVGIAVVKTIVWALKKNGMIDLLGNWADVNIPVCISEDGTLRIGRFTKGEWDRHGYPEWAYNKVNRPDDDQEFVVTMRPILEQAAGDCGAEEAMIVTIDEEYPAWLERKGLTGSIEALTEYIQSVSREDADRLMKKHRREEADAPFAIYVDLRFDGSAPETVSGTISKDTRRKIQESMELTGFGPAWAARYLIDEDALRNNISEFSSDAEAYFSSGTEVVCAKWEEISRRGAGTQRRYLPVFFDRNARNASLPLAPKLLRPGMQIPISVQGWEGLQREAAGMFDGHAEVVGGGILCIYREVPGNLQFKDAVYTEYPEGPSEAAS